MSPTFSAAHRNASFTGLHKPSELATLLPTTPTLRLLEVACGLNRAQVESLLAAPARPRHHFPERPSDLNAHQAVGVVLCGLLLSAIVGALIISLG